MANTRMLADETMIPLLEVGRRQYHMNSMPVEGGVEARRTSQWRRRTISVALTSAAFVTAWVPFIATCIIYQYVLKWAPAFAYNLMVVSVAGSVALCIAIWIAVLLLMKFHDALLARKLITPEVLPILAGMSVLGLSLALPMVLIFAMAPCESGEMAVLVQRRTGVATVMFTRASILDVPNRLVPHRVNDTVALLGLSHSVDGYVVAFDFAKHIANASDGASAVLHASDPGMEIFFPDGAYTVTIDAAYRDLSMYGDGERVLRLEDRSRLLGLDAYCVAKFELGDNDPRARARVLFPLGMILHGLASKTA